MNETHKVGTVAELFDVSSETIRRWAMEFEDYLSSSANPESGTTRLFSESDLMVFSLVNDVKEKGGTYDDAHARLRSGERGVVPDQPLDKTEQKIAINQLYESYKLLEIERNRYKEEVENLEEELQKAREEIARLKGVGEGHDRIEGDLKEARDRIEALIKQVARLEIRLEIEQEKNSSSGDSA